MRLEDLEGEGRSASLRVRVCASCARLCTLVHVDSIQSPMPPSPARLRGLSTPDRSVNRAPLHPSASHRVRTRPQDAGRVGQRHRGGMSGLPQYEYVKLADRIAAEIAAGTLPAGAALPGERAMTEIYSVSLGTVRRAVRELRARGLVATLPAKGTFVVGSVG